MKNKRILYIGNNLSKKGHTTTIMDTLGSLFTKEGCLVFKASSNKNIFFRLMHMLFSTIYYSRKVDYVLIDTYSTVNFWYTFFVSQTCRLLKLKYIPILHGGNLPKRLNSNPWVCDLIFKNAYKNVAPSNYLFSVFSEKYSKNLVSIPNVLEIENYKFTSRNFIQPKLLWVRSFSPIYNPKMAIQVLFELQKVYPSAELLMVGPDRENYIKEIKSLAKKLNVKVNFTGLLSKEEWISLSENYNIFINTANFDNMPVSVLEAMALGLPVVSTNVGGISFLLEDRKNALLVDKNDHKAMSSRIIELMNNINFTNYIIAEARKNIKKYDWQKVKSQWFEVMQ